MKKIIVLAALLVSGLMASTMSAQTEDPTTDKDGPNFSKLDVSPLDVVLFRDANEVPVAKVMYSRPQKRNREVFGNLVPYGEVWRTGANEATELTLYNDMLVGGQLVKAGTYSMYTIPEQNEWTVILNKSTNIWGAYDYHVEKDQVRIKVPVRQSDVEIEALSMAFAESPEGALLQIGWDDRYIEVPFKNPKN